MKLEEIVSVFLLVTLLISLPTFAIWYETYKYHDCKKVGHSTLYCILDIGK